jgi:hypothetical protein
MDRDLTNFRPSKIWRRMPLEHRIDAAGLFWDDEHSADQQMEAVSSIAGHMKFRPRSVIGLPPERRAKYLAQLPTIPDAIAARALVNYHLERQRPMMIAFLELIGIPHENGLIADDNTVKPEVEKIRSAARQLKTSFPPDDVTTYLSTLVSQDPVTWDALIEETDPSSHDGAVAPKQS